MTRTLAKLGDKMLAGLAPKAAAKGGCPPDPYTEYRCNNHQEQYRNCSTSGNCTTHCGTWTTISNSYCA